MLNNHFFSGKIFRVALVLILLIVGAQLLAGEKQPETIRAKEIKAGCKLQVGQAMDITLADYWRSNIIIDTEGVLGGRKNPYASHVLSLVEYKIDLPISGEFEIQAKYKASEISPTYLGVDGRCLGMVFENSGNFQGEYKSLAKFKARKDKIKLRFTSQYVETPFPVISALRIMYLGGEAPVAGPEPETVGYRKKLAKDWYKTISRKIHCDFHTGGFIKGIGKNFDAKEYGETLKKNGINSIAIFAKGHHGYAYYNTKIGTRHPGLDFDLMKAQIDACHKKGIAVWVYLSIALDEIYGSTTEHTKEEKNVQSRHFQRVNAYVDTPYITEYTWPMIVECVRDYDIDGFFFDFPGNEAFVQETIKLIKSIKPGVAIAYNHQWNKSRDELAKLDVLEIESWKHSLTLYHTPFVARYARGAVPLTSMLIRFWDSWGDFGGIADEAILAYQAASALANGCGVTIGDQLHPYGRLEPAVYERIGKVLKRVKKIEPFVFDSQSVAYVGLLRQVGRSGIIREEEKYCNALLDAGIHFDVIDETQKFKPYKAIVVPEGAKVDEEVAAKLEKYVRGGGNVLICGLLTEELNKLAGVTPARSESDKAYIRIDNDKLPTPPATDIYSYENVTTVKANEGTEVLADLVWPITHGTPHHVSHRYGPAQDVTSGFAAVTLREFGKGKVSYCAVELFKVYADKGYTAMREIVEDMLCKMIEPRERLTEVESEVPLEVSINRQGKRIIVHLVVYPQSRRASNYENPVSDGVLTVSNVVLKMPKKFIGKRIPRLIDPQGELKQYTRDGIVYIEVPDFTVGAVIIFEKPKGLF